MVVCHQFMEPSMRQNQAKRQPELPRRVPRKVQAANTQPETPRERFLEASGANLYFLDRILQSIGTSESGRFVEIGCGTGIFAKCLATASGLKAYGTEMSTTAWSIASRRLDCSLVHGIELPFEDGFFALVVAKDVLPMITDKKKWCEEVFRVLDKGGRFITYFPSERDFLEKPLYAFIQGSEALSKSAYGQPHHIVEAMVEAGFSKLYVERLHLGNVRFDFSYVDKHRSGFFSNSEGVDFKSAREQGLAEAVRGVAALNATGVVAHYEWERTLVIGEKI